MKYMNAYVNCLQLWEVNANELIANRILGSKDIFAAVRQALLEDIFVLIPSLIKSLISC